MESLAAVSLAGNMLQFVEFAKHLGSGAVEIHKSISGATSEHLEAEGIARRLQAFAIQLTTPEEPGFLAATDDEIELRAISAECVKVSNKILAILEDLKVKPGSSAMESLYKALKGEWEKGDLQSLQQRLDRLSHELANTIVPKQVHNLHFVLTLMMQQNERLAARREKDIRKLRGELSKDILDSLQEEGDRLNAALVLSGVAKQGTGYSAEQVILGTLRFQTMDERHAMIYPAHRKTYEWIFQTKDYLSWLSGDNNLYWISGKPGSGKSTLMKHIYHHPRTKERLCEWAKGQEVVMAHFYLWSASRKSLMKSQEGLLRSLLFQILREAPGLIRSAFPEQWDLLMQGPTSVFDQIQDITSTIELVKAFTRVSEHMKDFHLKFCFFLDGLDEYDGRPSDIIHMVQLLCLPSIKLCVSSRPWNEFENAFGLQLSTKLYMQTLNQRDIESYVIETFNENRQFQELAAAEGRQITDELVQYTVEAADGVFLWVYLVVQSLLEGMGNADKLTDLRKRLHSLPTDLDEYFERILFTVDNFYEKQTPSMFLICLMATDTLPLMAYWFIDELKDNVDCTMNLPVEPISSRQLYGRHKAMRKRLMACCKGLLEDRFIQSGENDSLSSSLLFNTRVDYLHRTVRDFLRAPERQQRLWDMAPVTFNAELNICQALLGLMKIIPQEKELFGPDGPIGGLIETLFRHICVFEDASIALQVEVDFMGRLDQTIQRHAQIVGDEVINHLPWLQLKPEASPTVLGSIEVGQLRFVGHYLDSCQPSTQFLASMLYHSLWPQWAQSTNRAHDSHIVVQFLVGRGIGPSLSLECGSTVWEAFIDALASDTSEFDSTKQTELFERLKVIISEDGRDLCMAWPTGDIRKGEPVLKIIQKKLNQDRFANLNRLLEAKNRGEQKKPRLINFTIRRWLSQRPKNAAGAMKNSIRKTLRKTKQ